jgi:hypothetical protein
MREKLPSRTQQHRRRRAAPATFTPRSLTERAADLGGSVKIQRDELQTTVTVSVPISNRERETERPTEYEHAS